MPCTWLKITSQYDLSDYAVEVRLDQLGVLGSVSDDGSDVYFLDENYRPLHYAIWLIRKDKNYGSVFVRLSLKANTPRTIAVCYGEENPYVDYNRPDLVFQLYDDFNAFDATEWRVISGNPTVRDGHLVLQGSTGDRVGTVEAFKDVEVRVYYYFAGFGNNGPRLSVQTRNEEYSYYDFIVEQRPTYGRYLILYCDTGYCETLAEGSNVMHYTTNVYYEEVIRCIGNSLTWILQGYMDSKETILATDPHYDTGLPGGAVTIGTWDAGNDVRVDKVLVRYAVDPEPSVEPTEAPLPPEQPPQLPEVVYPVSIYVDNVKVGEGTIKLVDEYKDDLVQRILERQVSGSVLVDSMVVGSASGSYEDYVAHGTGGARTVGILVRTFIDSVPLSQSTLIHTDRYGSVALPQILMLVMLVFIIVAVISTLIVVLRG
ncbi:MAG: DUF2341 domain-containing protein [Thermosphaera sp.]